MAWIADVAPQTTIRSVWGNGVRNQLVQVFTDLAEANSHNSVIPDGSLAAIGGLLHQKTAGVWRPVQPLPIAGALATLFPAGGLTTAWWFARVDIPAGYRSALAQYSAFITPVDGVSVSRAQIALYVDGVKVAAPTFTIPGPGIQISMSRLVAVNVAGTTLRFDVVNLTGATVPQNLYQDSQNHWANATAYPTTAATSLAPA